MLRFQLLVRFRRIRFKLVAPVGVERSSRAAFRFKSFSSYNYMSVPNFLLSGTPSFQHSRIELGPDKGPWTVNVGTLAKRALLVRHTSGCRTTRTLARLPAALLH